MKLIREHNDFGWTDNDNNLNGVKVKTPMGGELTIVDNGGNYVDVTWNNGEYSTSYYRKSVEAMIKSGTWRLTESTNDFDWTNTGLINPWVLGYTGIEFDIEPTRENLGQLIEMALTKTIANDLQWDDESREDDINSIINYFRSNDESYLAIDSSLRLSYGEKKHYDSWGNVKWVKYSMLIGNTLNENKDNDFDWIEDVTPNPFIADPFVVVFIDNKQVTEEEIEKLIILLKEAGVKASSWENVFDSLLDYGRQDLNAYLKVYVNDAGIKRLSYGTNRLLFEEYKWEAVDEYLASKHNFEYVEYKLKAIIRPDNLNESLDGLDWIRNTKPTFDENNLPRVGDVLICLPGYHAQPDGDFSDEKDDPNCAGFGYAEGRIIVVGEVDVHSGGSEEHRVVVWPDEEKSGMYWDYDDEVCFECGVYGFALTYYTGENLNENEEEKDEFDWVRDVKAGIHLDINTVYYFDPKLTAKESEIFANNIANAPEFKNWLLNLPNANSSVVRDGGIKYFMTKPERPIRVGGWCTETNLDYVTGVYPGVNVVNGRDAFNF
jgi:hypothetical protein